MNVLTRWMLAVVVFAGVAGPLQAEPGGPTLSAAGIFGLHMVLQRDSPIPVWGWAPPDTAVTVELGPRRGDAVRLGQVLGPQLDEPRGVARRRLPHRRLGAQVRWEEARS